MAACCERALIHAAITLFHGTTSDIGKHFATYPANRDARERLTDVESVNYRRVHRLDRINRHKPAKPFDYNALRLNIQVQTVWPVYLDYPRSIHKATSPTRRLLVNLDIG
jgi:uncharacterized protein YijF (DUF1287 family)